MASIYRNPQGWLHSVFDHLQRVSHAAIFENKRLGEVLAWIKQQQVGQP
jgi:hypothetical protein